MKKTTALALALLIGLASLLGATACAEGYSTQLLESMLNGSDAAPVSVEDGALLNWEGYSVRLLEYEIFKSPNSAASLNLFARIVNDTDRKLSLWLNDATVDGVTVMVVPILGTEPHTDTGVDAPEKFYVFAEKENKQAASDAIAAARQLQGTLVLRDAGTDEVLLQKSVVIDLSGLEGSRDIQTPRPTEAPTPTPTPRATPTPDTGSYRETAPAYTPASYDFQTLKQGSKGQAVRDLQQRLTDLGYLNDKVDGAFGRNTTTAVRSFQTQNGLPVGNEATPEMQSLLYSSRAEYYVEPYIPLVIGATYTLETPQQTGLASMGMMNIMLVNRSPTRGIRGYVLSYYQTDMYGNRLDLDPDGRGLTHMEFDEMNYIEPGHYKDSFTYVIGNFYGTYAVYVGVQKIVFDDGEIREIDLDDVSYCECAIHR